MYFKVEHCSYVYVLIAYIFYYWLLWCSQASKQLLNCGSACRHPLLFLCMYRKQIIIMQLESPLF